MGQQDSWRELFDVVIAKANKPAFYKSDHPFRFGSLPLNSVKFSLHVTLVPTMPYPPTIKRTQFMLYKTFHNTLIYSTGLIVFIGCLCSCYDVEKDTLAFTKVDTFFPGKIYYHGCLKTFLQITKWKGPEVRLTKYYGFFMAGELFILLHASLISQLRQTILFVCIIQFIFLPLHYITEIYSHETLGDIFWGSPL